MPLYWLMMMTETKKRKEEEEMRAMLDFVEWIISENGGQQTLLEVQYPPIYPGNQQLATYAEIVIDTIQNSLTN